jgi:hypothetical protein
MRPVTRQEYIELLRNHQGIDDPSVAQIELLCPHLTYDQIMELLGDATRPVRFPLPPVVLQRCYQLAYYVPGNLPVFQSAWTVLEPRPTAEACVDPAMARDIPPALPYAAEAMAYAERFWGDDLVRIDWVDHRCIKLVEPPPAPPLNGKPGRGVVTCTLYFTLTRSYDELMDDPGGPEVDAWDEAIQHIVSDDFVGDELCFGDLKGVDYNCARCGAAVGFDRCRGCEVRMLNDDARPVWKVPLPPKLVAYLQAAGHDFALDPSRLYAPV